MASTSRAARAMGSSPAANALAHASTRVSVLSMKGCGATALDGAGVNVASAARTTTSPTRRWPGPSAASAATVSPMPTRRHARTPAGLAASMCTGARAVAGTLSPSKKTPGPVRCPSTLARATTARDASSATISAPRRSTLPVNTSALARSTRSTAVGANGCTAPSKSMSTTGGPVATASAARSASSILRSVPRV